MPQDMVQFEGSPFIDRNLFYKFNIAYWRKLFQVADYPSIDIVSRVEYVESGIGKDIIIVVETERQDSFHKIEDFISIGHIEYCGSRNGSCGIPFNGLATRSLR
jgi:hypothetical protein